MMTSMMDRGVRGPLFARSVGVPQESPTTPAASLPEGSLAQIIKKRLTQLGVSQLGFCNANGLNRTFLYPLLNGQNPPRQRTGRLNADNDPRYTALARALGFPEKPFIEKVLESQSGQRKVVKGALRTPYHSGQFYRFFRIWQGFVRGPLCKYSPDLGVGGEVRLFAAWQVAWGMSIKAPERFHRATSAMLPKPKDDDLGVKSPFHPLFLEMARFLACQDLVSPEDLPASLAQMFYGLACCADPVAHLASLANGTEEFLSWFPDASS